MEEFSKLSIRNKSTTISQSMQWIIPQSRLNQHCPFLEQEYPYFTTEFSILHPSSVLEVKWRLEMQRKNNKVSVNLLNMNEKEFFEKSEALNVQVRWNIRLKSGQDDGPMGILSEQMFHQRENMEINRLQFFKESQSEGRVVCDLESFDSFEVDGNFAVEVKLELEHFQLEEKKMSFIDRSRRVSASLSELTEPVYSNSKQRKNLSISSDTSCLSAPCHSWIPGQHPQLVSSTLNRSKQNVVQALSQQLIQQQLPHHHHHQQAPFSSHFGNHSLRRSRSGRMPSSTLEHISKARHLSGQLDESQASEYFDTEQIYSIIPDYLFSDAVPAMSTAPVQLQFDGEFQHSNEDTTIPFDTNVYNPHVLPTPTMARVNPDPLLETPVFQTQYYRSTDSPLSASNSSVSICSASTSIISSIYTGKVQDPTYILKNRRKLLEIGVKHNLPALVRDCEESYLHTLQVINSLETILVIDNFLPGSEVRNTVIKFMKMNLKELMKDHNWDKFVENCDELVTEILAAE